MSSSSDDSANHVQRDRRDLVARGSRKSTPLGTALFIGLRALDPFIQYGILARGWGSGLLHRVGLETLPAGLPTATGIAPIDALGLSPYRLILLAMAVGSSLKQIYWLVALSYEEFPPSAAVVISLFNTLHNSVNSLAFTTAALSASTAGSSRFPQVPLLVGGTMYIMGILAETVSEWQRKRFKEDPKNKGKAYTGGLWSLARHINYGGYTLWRTGYALSAAGWTWASILFAFFTWDFANRAIPVLDSYCSKRYGEQWASFKAKVPYKLFPGIY